MITDALSELTRSSPPVLFGMFTSPYAWLIVVVLGFLLFGKKFARFIGIPEWATFRIGERKYDLPLIVLICVGFGFIIGRLTSPPVVIESSEKKTPDQAVVIMVTRVLSGNSFQIKLGDRSETILLRHVEIPSEGTPEYEKANGLLEKLVRDKRITLDYGKAGKTSDSHGRTIATAYGNGVNLNQEMIRLLKSAEL